MFFLPDFRCAMLRRAADLASTSGIRLWGLSPMGKLPCTSFTGSSTGPTPIGVTVNHLCYTYEVLEDEDFKDLESGKELCQDDLVGN